VGGGDRSDGNFCVIEWLTGDGVYDRASDAISGGRSDLIGGSVCGKKKAQESESG